MRQPVVTTSGQAFQDSLGLTTCTHTVSLVRCTDSNLLRTS